MSWLLRGVGRCSGGDVRVSACQHWRLFGETGHVIISCCCVASWHLSPVCSLSSAIGRYLSRHRVSSSLFLSLRIKNSIIIIINGKRRWGRYHLTKILLIKVVKNDFFLHLSFYLSWRQQQSVHWPCVVPPACASALYSFPFYSGLAFFQSYHFWEIFHRWIAQIFPDAVVPSIRCYRLLLRWRQRRRLQRRPELPVPRDRWRESQPDCHCSRERRGVRTRARRRREREGLPHPAAVDWGGPAPGLEFVSGQTRRDKKS